ncbi:LysR family transcriptional regulator [Paenibacillus wynnii]|uniref:LysR family transcriptional regulator n=1 Tax=Paenibacillus wynnii TaxID=268407 RepID=UPI002791F5E9|nr:LysR family transcriptional regulator [Paenibacillus wynnii]MDQ0195014.1 DNA-binding transcriptional LysR family regulator [Paenibacillus wynnii]
MNYMKLHVLVLIEKYKKVTDVASELGLKQPTVTFHMKSLESELGTPLFQYRSGRVLLTEAGRTLYQYAVKIVYLTAEAERSIKQFTSPFDGELEIEAGYIPGTYLLPKAISSFMKMYPGSKLSLTIQPDALLRERLRLQEIHFALLHSVDTSDKSFNYQLLDDEDAVLIYAPGHPFDGNHDLTVEQVASAPWVQHIEGSTLRTIADKWAQLNQVRLWNRTELNAPETLKAIISEGDAVGIFSKKGIEAELSSGRLRYSNLPGIQTEFGGFMLAWRKDYALSPLQQAFVKMI